MILRDILPNHPIKHITVKANGRNPDEDEIIGYCSWDGEHLIPLDGDLYSLDCTITKYEYDGDQHLTYWEQVDWI